MVIFITGISSGFGLETAKLLATKGHKVYGTIRRDTELIPGIQYIKLDVRNSDEVNNAVKTIFDKEGRIDVLINNAGMGIGGPIEFATEEEVKTQVDTNFMGLVRCVKAVLPIMRKQGSGKIIAISSIGGLMGLPFQGFYSASKYAIEGYCEALHLETRNFGIKVVVIRPGDFSTGFTSNRKKTDNPEALNVYKSYAKSMDSIEHDENGGLKPIVLAKKIDKIVNAKRPKYGYTVASPVQKLSVFVKKILPPSWYAKILGAYYKL